MKKNILEAPPKQKACMFVLNLHTHKIFLSRDESYVPHKGKLRHSNYQANLKIADIRKQNLNQLLITSSYLLFKHLIFSFKKNNKISSCKPICNVTFMLLEFWQSIFNGSFLFSCHYQMHISRL